MDWVAHVVGLFAEAEGRLPKDLAEVFTHRLPAGRRGDAMLDLFSHPLEYAPDDDGKSFVIRSLGKDGKPGGKGADADVTAKRP